MRSLLASSKPGRSPDVLAWPAHRNAKENPYNHLLYNSLENNGVRVAEFGIKSALFSRFEILHIHWPDALLKNVKDVRAVSNSVVFAILVIAVRYVRRKPIIWTVHNISPHGDAHPIAKWILYSSLSATVTGTIHLSESSVDVLAERLPRLARRPYWVIPHGLYSPSHTRKRPLTSLQDALDSDRRIRVGFVGTVARYKGVHEFFDLADNLPEDIPIDFVIEGKPEDGSLEFELRERAKSIGNLQLRFGWLTENDLASALATCDLVVYPYRNSLNSGSMILALEVGIPVVVPESRVTREISSEVGPGWVRTYEGGLSSDKLIQFASVEPPTTEPNLGARDWGRIAVLTAEAYTSILSSADGGKG